MTFVPFTLLGQAPLSVAGVELNNTSQKLESALIDGKVNYNAEKQTLTLENATLKGEIHNRGIELLHIELIGENKIEKETGALFLEKATIIEGEGSLITKCGSNYTDIYHEKSLQIINCSIKTNTFRGVNDAFLELENVSFETERGIFWERGIVFKDCLIVEPSNAVYNSSENAIAVGGKFFDGKVIIRRVEKKKPTFQVQQNTIGNGTLTISGYEDLNAVPQGTKLSVIAKPKEGYKLDELTANGKAIQNNELVITEDTKIKAVFSAITAIESVANPILSIQCSSSQIRISGLQSQELFSIHSIKGVTIIKAKADENGNANIRKNFPSDFYFVHSSRGSSLFLVP